MDKKYVDTYKDYSGRIDLICPYCGNPHSVSKTAKEWGCRACGNTFAIKSILGLFYKAERITRARI